MRCVRAPLAQALALSAEPRGRLPHRLPSHLRHGLLRLFPCPWHVKDTVTG